MSTSAAAAAERPSPRGVPRTEPRWPVRRPVRWSVRWSVRWPVLLAALTATALAVVGLVVVPPVPASGVGHLTTGGAVGQGADGNVLVVEADTVTIVVDPAPGHGATTATVQRRVTVDGRTYGLPGLADVGPADRVRVTLVADPALTEAEALAEAAAGGPGARVVEITAVARTTGTADRRALATTGTHTLVVLPVYWDDRDASTRTSLEQAADQTATYWQRQSGGRLTVRPTVRDWRPIADPGTCVNPGFEDRVLASALAAHGEAGSTPTRHVAVYFPETVGCGYDGQAEVGGGTIWLNGPGGDAAGGAGTGDGPDAEYTHYVLAHELGHNLGLGHANTLVCTQGATPVTFSDHCVAQEYADRTDVMGVGNRSTPGNLSAAFADQLGFARTRTVEGIAPGDGDTTVTLAPTGQVDAVRAIRLPLPGRTLDLSGKRLRSGLTFYVEFRPAVPPDVHEPAWAGVQVRVVVHDEWGTPETYLLDMQPSSRGMRMRLPVATPWTVPGAAATLTVRSEQPTGATVVLSPSRTLSPVQRYVERVYRDLFHRSVDATGLVTWTRALETGTPRVAVAHAITSSDEYRGRLVTRSYRTFLNRAPEPAGLAHWVRTLGSGLTIQQMEAGFLASPEYYRKAGGTPAGWVTGLYRHVLDRGAAPAEIRFWTDRLARGDDRSTVALGFLLSTEHLTTVVDGYYQELLGRSIDPTGRATWVSLIQAGHRVEEIIGGIVASEEYFARR